MVSAAAASFLPPERKDRMISMLRPRDPLKPIENLFDIKETTTRDDKVEIVATLLGSFILGASFAKEFFINGRFEIRIFFFGISCLVLFVTVSLVSRIWIQVFDVNKKIEPDMSASRSDIIKAQAATIEAMPISVRPLEPQKAHIPEQEQSQYERTTSESGWPRVLSEEERQDPRPFRHVHIATENEALAEETSETDNPPSNNE